MIDKFHETTDVVALTVPTDSVLTVACKLGGADGDPRSLAIARVTALKIGSITG